MADYKAIRGFTIQTYSSDPPSPPLGQVWYNSSSKKLKVAKLGSGTWATSNTYPQSVYGAQGCGLQTAALGFGGQPGGNAESNEYNGTSWSAEAAMNNGTYYVGGGAGTQTAAMWAGGKNPGGSVQDKSEEYNGTSWTDGNTINKSRQAAQSVGVQTAALLLGGAPTGSPSVESYDGTNWTAGTDLNSPRTSGVAAGTQTSTLFYAGEDTAVRAYSEEWNGSSWTEVADQNTNRYGGAGWGEATLCLLAGGYEGVTAYTESWDGTSWTEVADMPSAKSAHGSNGGTTTAPHDAGVTFTGSPSEVNTTEEWTVAAPSGSDVTAS